MLEEHDKTWKSFQSSLVHEHTKSVLKHLVTLLNPIREAINNLFQSETHDLPSGNISLDIQDKVCQWLTKHISNRGTANKIIFIYLYMQFYCLGCFFFTYGIHCAYITRNIVILK